MNRAAVALMAIGAAALLVAACSAPAPSRAASATAAGARSIADPATTADVNPFDPIALNNLAVAKSEQGDYATALQLLDRASRLAPEQAMIAANLARMRRFLLNRPAAEPVATPVETIAMPPEPPALWQPGTPRMP